MFNNHNHDEYSNALLGFADVVIKVPELIQRSYDLGLDGISITNHEGISSHFEAINYYEKMEKDRPFKLGLGNEIYLVEDWEDEHNRDPEKISDHGFAYPYYHFVLTALDTEGHKQLRQLSTRAWLRAYKRNIWRRPTLYSDLEEIIKPNQGHIVASTACLGSRVDRLLLDGEFDKAEEEVNRLVDIFGEGNIYLEVQPAKEEGTDQSKVNRLMKQMAKATGVKIIPTTDSHYLSKEDAIIHKVYLQSQDGDREVDDFYATAYLMGADELREYLRIDFTDEQIDQMYEWSNEIADRIQEHNIKHDPIIPQIPIDKIPKDFRVQGVFKKWYGAYPNFEYYASPERPLHERYFFYQIEQGLIKKIVEKDKDIEIYIARCNEEWEELRIISEQLDTSMPSYYSTMSHNVDLIWECNSLAMPARGSAAGFLTCYLLDVTQIDPVPLGDYFPSWRHLNHQRGVELPDIDNDSEASKKKAIVEKMKEYFGEDKVLNVATFSRLSSKTAIERACKGLGLPDDTAAYLKSLVPVNRGKVQKLKDCIYGNEAKGIKPVYDLINEMAQHPNLQESALALEGLIVNRGTHAAGVIVSNNSYTDYISAMRSADGTPITSYDLWKSEEAGCIKFDMLTVVAADKIHKTMDLLLEYGKIEWQGSLKKTYEKYLHPDVLEYDNPEMWEILPSIYSIFQFDTPISSKALSATKPQSVMDLSAANSLLRLMPDNADETPIDRYIRYKNSHKEWVQDTVEFGLNDEERECLWQYLSDAYGLADSQEKIMRLSMDERVSGYTLKEANLLRKSIAAKDEILQAKAKEDFFDYGNKLGTRHVFLDYIWNVVFAASMGYSFSQLHSYSYSIIALQELNLNFFYPRVYWNCACLSIEASGLTDEGESDKTATTNYGEVAKAIYKMRNSGVEVSPPSINNSNLDFTPVEENDSILFGIAGIAGINGDIAKQVIDNRPYTSFKDFYAKNAYQGSLITPSKFRQLIKAGCFDELNPDRVKVMKLYILYSNAPVESLTMANLPMIVKSETPIPRPLLAPYNFNKYITSKEFFYGNHPKFKTKKLYWLDDKATKYFKKNCQTSLQESVDYFFENDMLIIVDKAIEKLLKPSTTALREYINTPEFLEAYNKKLLLMKYNEFVPNQDVHHWEFEATSYYHNGKHELDRLDKDKYLITDFNDLPEEPIFVERSWGKKTWKQYDIHQIAGTVLDRNDNSHLVTLLTTDNQVVSIKFHSGLYAQYKRQNSIVKEDGKKEIIDPSYFARGQLLVVCGYRRGEADYICKKYSRSVFQHHCQRIWTINEDGLAEIQSSRMFEEE